MRVAIGNDHAGYEVKNEVRRVLEEMGLEVVDFGTSSSESVDYPDFASKVAEVISTNEFERGVLICGSGIGMAIVANKFPGIRAAVCHNVETARLSREHNDANVLAVGSRTTPLKTFLDMIRVFFTTDFAGGRHIARTEKIKRLDSNWNHHMTLEKGQ